ncbi:MAG: hypothetical protein JW793_06525, partial [Acidobacteria bacterium]|nr:hypothetical protein [Acidobacteriota bacterium]
RYTFNMKESKFETDEQGNPGLVEENEYEIFPYLDEDLTYRRHISKNGRPLSPEEIEKQDREHEKKLEERKKDLEKSGIDEEADYLEREKIERLKEGRIIREIPRIYDIKMTGRETLEGRSTILLEFEPRPDYEPKSRETDILSKLAGRAWFCEQDYQVVQLEVEFVENLSLGLGLLARLHKGSKAVVRRRYVNGEVWLPAGIHFTGTARLFLLKKVRINTLIEYSNYRKFRVRTSHSFRAVEE